MKIIIIFALFIAGLQSLGDSAPVRSRLPSSIDWKPTQYDKVLLPKKIPEGVILIQNKNKDNVAYSAAYFVGDNILRNRVLPRETYLKMKEDLRLNVIASAKTKVFDSNCTNQIIVSNGTFTSNGNEVPSRNGGDRPICLNSHGRFSKAESSFRRWYLDARNIFGL